MRLLRAWGNLFVRRRAWQLGVLCWLGFMLVLCAKVIELLFASSLLTIGATVVGAIFFGGSLGALGARAQSYEEVMDELRSVEDLSAEMRRAAGVMEEVMRREGRPQG